MSRHLLLSLMVVIPFLSGSLVFAQASDYDRRPRTASVSGRVTVDGKPSANIAVTVTETHSSSREARIFTLEGREVVDRQSYQVLTDAEGKYRIADLPPGEYQVSPKAPTLVSADSAYGPDYKIKITLDEGEARSNVDFALERGGVITGRVTDEDGRPQVGRYVQIAALAGRTNEVGMLRIPTWNLETDDRGVYRIFGLRPGRYIVAAGGEDDTLKFGIKGKATQRTYHPDVVRQEDARVVEVAGGEEATGIDIRLRNPAKSYTASGRVIDFETGKPLPHVFIYCYKVEKQEDDYGSSSGYASADVEGNFTLRWLKPGKYKARIVPQQEGSDYYSDAAYFEVSDGDVSGVKIVARRGAVVNGTLVVEGVREAAGQVDLSPGVVRGNVYKIYYAGDQRRQINLRWFHTQVGKDGSFRVTGLPPGLLEIGLSGHWTGALPIHLLRVEHNGVDVSRGMEIGEREEINGLRIFAAIGRGTIRGTVRVVGGALPEGIHLTVLAVRDGEPHISGHDDADEKGRFLINGLLTGEYTLTVGWGRSSGNSSSIELKLPPPSVQRVSVTNGAETQLDLTIDLSRKVE